MRLPRAYMTSRQVGVALRMVRERVRQIEDAAIGELAARLGCTPMEAIAHLYVIQWEEHGDTILRTEADPPEDEAWIDRYWGRHEKAG